MLSRMAYLELHALENMEGIGGRGRGILPSGGVLCAG